MSRSELEPSASGAAQFSVFVDDSGTKHRRVRRAGRLLALALLTYTLVLLAGVVLPLPFSGVRLPPAAPDDALRLRTLPSVPEAADAVEALVGPAPALGLEGVAGAGTNSATGGTTIPTRLAMAESPPPPAQILSPPAPSAAPSPAAPAPSGGTVVAARSDRAPRSGVATAPPAPSSGSEVAAARAPAGAARQSTPPAAPPAEPRPTRAAGR